MKRKYDVSIIGGLGHVGLPLGLAFAKAGKKVVAIDISKEKRELVKKKIIPFEEKGSQELLDKYLDVNFFVSGDISEAGESSIIIITAGTPLDNNFNADLSQIEAILHDLIPVLTTGQMIVMRSTVSPNTTKYVKNFLDVNSQFTVGKDLFLAMIPERISEGASLKELYTLPQIVGVFDDKSFRIAKELFEVLNSDILRASPIEAELAKLFANNFRYISFAIANEFFMIADQLEANPFKVFKLVNYKYPRGGIKSPGFAKGPCLGKDSWLLTNSVPTLVGSTGLTSSAFRVNEALPMYCFTKIKNMTSLSGKTIALLGLTFKRDSDDLRDSSSMQLLQLLKNEFLDVITHDPFVDKKDIKEVLKKSDIVIIAMNHSYYEKFSADELVKLAGKHILICDPWNVCKTERFTFWTSEL